MTFFLRLLPLVLVAALVSCKSGTISDVASEIVPQPFTIAWSLQSEKPRLLFVAGDEYDNFLTAKRDVEAVIRDKSGSRAIKYSRLQDAEAATYEPGSFVHFNFYKYGILDYSTNEIFTPTTVTGSTWPEPTRLAKLYKGDLYAIGSRSICKSFSDSCTPLQIERDWYLTSFFHLSYAFDTYLHMGFWPAFGITNFGSKLAAIRGYESEFVDTHLGPDLYPMDDTDAGELRGVFSQDGTVMSGYIQFGNAGYYVTTTDSESFGHFDTTFMAPNRTKMIYLNGEYIPITWQLSGAYTFIFEGSERMLPDDIDCPIITPDGRTLGGMRDDDHQIVEFVEYSWDGFRYAEVMTAAVHNSRGKNACTHGHWAQLDLGDGSQGYGLIYDQLSTSGAANISFVIQHDPTIIFDARLRLLAQLSARDSSNGEPDYKRSLLFVGKNTSTYYELLGTPIELKGGNFSLRGVPLSRTRCAQGFNYVFTDTVSGEEMSVPICNLASYSYQSAWLSYEFIDEGRQLVIGINDGKRFTVYKMPWPVEG